MNASAHTSDDFTDAELIEFLDNQLDQSRRLTLEACLKTDASLVERVSELTIDTDALKAAFDPLLTQVPSVDLSEQPAINANHSDTYGVSRFALAACIVCALAMGWFAKSFLYPATAPLPMMTADWRVAVAEYQRLYTVDTLPTDVPDVTQVVSQLESVSIKSGLTITPEMVDLPGLSFRRAQTLGIDGQPLIQIAFASAEGRPVALCFTRNTDSTKTMVQAELLGMNSVAWGNGEFGFILIGDVPQAVLDTSAKAMASQLL